MKKVIKHANHPFEKVIVQPVAAMIATKPFL